jgi:hypothetical protein
MSAKSAVIALTVLLLAALMGCSNGPTDSDSYQAINLGDEFGGYTTEKEAPAFGDSELLAEEEVEVTDPMLGSPEVTDLTADPEAGLFHFRVVWGQLCYDSTVTEVTDWSGSLSVSRGALIVRRLIRFERGQDSLMTRTDRALIEWTSATTVHNDGLAVDLFVPPADDTEPVTVTFATGPYTRVFDLAELAALDTVVSLDNGGAVALHAWQLFRVPCPRGFVVGRWGHDSTGQGVFRGRWLTVCGQVAGYLRGHFGRDEFDQKVLYGKWIDLSGNVEGFLAGTYQPVPDPSVGADVCCRSGGWFAARIYDAEHQPIGQMHGRYRAAPSDRHGFFQGRWKLDCNQIVPQRFRFGDGFERERGL